MANRAWGVGGIPAPSRAFLLSVESGRGPGGPRYSRPGGRRYTFLQVFAMAVDNRTDSIPIAEMLY